MTRLHWIANLVTSAVVSAWVPVHAVAQDPQEQRNEPPVVEEEQKTQEIREEEPALMSLLQKLPDYLGATVSAGLR